MNADRRKHSSHYTKEQIVSHAYIHTPSMCHNFAQPEDEGVKYTHIAASLDSYTECRDAA
jgi:hypothetical protein